MFETAVVHAQGRRPQQRVGLFTASVALHTFVAVAAIAISIQSISFPTSAPNQIEIFTPMVPLPMTGGGGAVKPATPEPPKPQPVAQQQITAPPQPVAPTTVPDAVPTVASSATSDVGPSGPATGGPGTFSSDAGPGGPGPGGPGIGEGPAIGDAVPDVIFQPGADVRSAVVLSRVQPGYPTIAVRARLGGSVTVHCVIDRNGRIRDPQVIRSTSSMFDQSAVDAVKQWTFAPGTMHGKAVDTYFELTVTFAVR